jgi:hypothetical protein
MEREEVCWRLGALACEARRRGSPIAVPAEAASAFDALVAEGARLVGHDPRLSPIPGGDHPRASGFADREFLVLIDDARAALGCGPHESAAPGHEADRPISRARGSRAP